MGKKIRDIPAAVAALIAPVSKIATKVLQTGEQRTWRQDPRNEN
jgi:hypothetical protein